MEVVVPVMPECTEPCGACGDDRDVYVVELLVRPGDTVAADQPVAVVETEKSSVEVAAPAAGRVASVPVRPGQRVREGAVLVTLSDD